MWFLGGKRPYQNPLWTQELYQIKTTNTNGLKKKKEKQRQAKRNIEDHKLQSSGKKAKKKKKTDQ